jgi:hypothetical protein
VREFRFSGGEYPGWMLSLQGQYRNKPPVNA